MTEVDKNKERLEVVEDEYKRLPILIGQILQVMQLKGSQTKNIDTARWRYAFRMLMTKYVIEAFIKRGTFGDIEMAADALGETIMLELKGTVDRLVGDLLEFSEKEGRKKAKD